MPQRDEGEQGQHSSRPSRRQRKNNPVHGYNIQPDGLARLLSCKSAPENEAIRLLGPKIMSENGQVLCELVPIFGLQCSCDISHKLIKASCKPLLLISGLR